MVNEILNSLNETANEIIKHIKKLYKKEYNKLYQRQNRALKKFFHGKGSLVNYALARKEFEEFKENYKRKYKKWN